ncbi:MAG: ABC transporter substrate-binding protein [Oligoflexia bacterium]|nr:ABC transporter substrate-binding protein [Oligoflexia bacterium]
MKSETITMGVAMIMVSTPVIVAYKKGFFEREGLTVKFKQYSFGKQAIEAMFSKENDIATVAETPIVFKSFERNDFAIFATFSESYNDCKIIVKKNSGIMVASDLKGKRVGVTKSTSSHYFLNTYLLENLIKVSSVDLHFYDPLELQTALQSGVVDAIVVFEPYAYMAAQALHGEAFTLPAARLFRETFSFVANKDWVYKHPETIEKILRAMEAAISFIHQNRDETITLLASEIELSKEYVASIWDSYMFQLSLDNAIIPSLEDEAKWTIKSKLVEGSTIPNYLDYFYPEAMRVVKPDAVSIIK